MSMSKGLNKGFNRGVRTAGLRQRGTALLVGAALVATLALPAMVPEAHAEQFPQLTQLIRDNRDAVVHIAVVGERGSGRQQMFSMPDGSQLPEQLRRFFENLPDMPRNNRAPRTEAMGSGFIISPDGYIVTNAHVVDGGSEVTVKLNDRRELPAKVVGQDKYSDIALLKVEASGLPTVRLGDSDSLEVGQWVVAIGAPFGLDHTATQGIVSALSRSLPDGTYVPFIQTDAAVNPGNSGGPLFDLNGNVVGVNSQIYSRSGGYMGISFAIPVNLVRNITDQLKDGGVVSRGWLGVEIQSLDQQLADSFKLGKPKGALVASVQPSSPAARAGVQAGDVILGFNNQDVESASHLPLLVGNTPVGQQVPLKVLRDGEEKVLTVTIDQLADRDENPTRLADNTDGSPSLGVAVAALSPEERERAKVDAGGIVIREVFPGSAADRAGLQQGDVILRVDNQPVSTPSELKDKVSKAPENRPLALLIQRDDAKRFVAVQPSKS
ncbi:MAG: DegQ family serine endoprotease [Thiothrix sp.]|nr:DegQ family serine endoprotease [Thiothrix sp.]HPQ95776.1 DegQ family serine endoprotease [Thiolinea sp.]